MTAKEINVAYFIDLCSSKQIGFQPQQEIPEKDIVINSNKRLGKIKAVNRAVS